MSMMFEDVETIAFIPGEGHEEEGRGEMPFIRMYFFEKSIMIP